MILHILKKDIKRIVFLLGGVVNVLKLMPLDFPRKTRAKSKETPYRRSVLLTSIFTKISKCPDCNNIEIKNNSYGETYCGKCGLVFV